MLVVQQALEDSELLLAGNTTTTSNNLVTLYKALGGGWEADLPDAPKPDSTKQAAASPKI